MADVEFPGDPKRVPRDQPDRAVLGPVPTFVIGTVIIALHAWFLFMLEDEYRHRYFSLAEGDWGKVTDWVGLWIPIFLLTMGIEIAYSYVTGTNLYRVNDSLSSLGCGSLLTLIKKLFAQTPLAIGLYSLVWHHWGRHIVAEVMPVWYRDSLMLQWWLAFLGIEFGYYWVHRTGHTMHCFWAMHGVHHSSEEYNLSTALRQSSMHTFFSSLYYLPLALIMSPPLYVLQSYFNLLYQYWIHTRVVGKMGVLEYVLNTPSQHRVHHGRNAYCIDKNYGGTLCIFDRMFGTFQEEIEEVPVVYGLTHSLNTFDPVEANLHTWRNIFHAMWFANTTSDMFLILYKGPGWVACTHPHEEWPIPPCTNLSTRKYNTKLSTGMKVILVAEFLAALGLFDGALKHMDSSMGAQYHYVVAVALLAGAILWCIGLTSDRHPRALSFQILLILATGALVSYGQTLYSTTLLPGNPTLQQRIAVVLSLTATALWAVLEKRREFALPIDPATELGRDYACAAQAERKQWEGIHEKAA